LADTAAAMRCSDRTVRRRMRDGSLPHRKDGARLLVFLADAATSEIDTGAASDHMALTAEVARLTDIVRRQDATIENLWAALQREQALALQRPQLEAPHRPWRWPWQR